jgi:hypothetical protein
LAILFRIFGFLGTKDFWTIYLAFQSFNFNHSGKIAYYSGKITYYSGRITYYSGRITYSGAADSEILKIFFRKRWVPKNKPMYPRLMLFADTKLNQSRIHWFQWVCKYLFIHATT